MAWGPGKYDALCTMVREQAGARAAIIIIVDGALGHGMSCQAEDDVLAQLPDILDEVAVGIRAAGGKKV